MGNLRISSDGNLRPADIIRPSLRFLFTIAATLCCYLITAQTVTGVITDAESGEPIIGASVLEKETNNNGTVTDLNGKYTLELQTANPILEVSYVGYQAIDVPYEGQNNLDIQLASGLALQEVVVTALDISKSEEALGYAASTLSSKDLSTTQVTNFASALYGKAPGVSVRSVPGGATSGVNINIRGFSSITGNTQPLIVMDGVPIRNGEFANTNYWGDQRIRGNGLVDINPEDIESMTVLKGASAAALYGSDAVNGVVVITTKKGTKKQGLGVEFSAGYNMDKIAYLPRYQNVRGPGIPSSFSDNGQRDDRFILVDTDGDGEGDTRGLMNENRNFGPEFDGEPVLAWDGQIRPYESPNSSYADLFQDAKSANANLSISHATEKSNLRFSFTRQDNQMISYGSKNERNIANLTSSFQLSDNLNTRLIVKYINQFTKDRPHKVDRMINNFGGMMDRFESADWYFDRYQTSLGYRFKTGTQESLTPDENIIYNGFKSDIADFVWRINEHHSEESSNRIIANLQQNWEIVEGLNLRGRIATDFTTEKIEDWNSTRNPSVLYSNPGGGFSIRNNVNNRVYGDVLLSYETKIHPDLEMTLMGGYTAQKDLYTWVNRGTNGGLSTENLFDIAASINTPNSNSERIRLVKDALLGTLDLGYKDFLYLQGTVRRDRTSQIAPNNNTFVYPSVNTSFLLNKAFDLPRYIQLAKIRASYGIVGNYPGIYRANIAYNQNTLGVQAMGGQPILYTNISAGFGNDLIRPEQKHEFEIGVNVNFLTRFDIDVSYYDGKIVDQILPVDIPRSSGASTVLTNIGTLRNKGVELRLMADIFEKDDFGWTTILNYSKNTNIVERLANDATELLHADFDGNAAQIRSIVGQPMGDIYAHPVATNENGEKIVGASGLYQLDGDNWEKYGNAMPDFEGGFINNFYFKGFSLDVVADFSYGGAIMPTGIYWMTSRGLTEESLNYMNAERGGLRYYKNEDGIGVQTTGDRGPNGEPVFNDGVLLEGVLQSGEPNSNVVSQAQYYANTYNWGGPQYGNSRYELYINDNNWVKVREIALGYNLPKQITSAMGMQNLNLSVYGRNLFFIYRSIKDLDPEQTTAGSKWFQNINNAGNNPSFRSFGVQLRASF